MTNSTISAPRGLILIVDDDENLRRAATLRLNAAGYATDVATNGEEGLEKVRTSSPDAILLDVRMPRKDGLAMLADLRADETGREIPVIMVSASVRDQQRALKAGALYFMTKPYNGKMLLAIIEAVCNEQHVWRPL